MLGKIPYNVGKPLRALTTKFLLETKEMAELITLGMVIMSRIGQSAGKIPKSVMARTRNSLRDLVV